MSNENSIVVVDHDTITIDGRTFKKLEYKGEFVMTTSEISEHHNIDVKHINEKFRRSKKHLIIGRDYYEVPMEEVLRSRIATANSKDRSNYLLLITISGYLNFVKTINDDKAWGTQRKLANTFIGENNPNGALHELLENSTPIRNGLTHEWAVHEAKDYRGLTRHEYKTIFKDDTIRKKNMCDGEKGMLAMFEYCEQLKLKNNPDINGDHQLSNSITETGGSILDIIKPKQPELTH